jgi:hypothetical protein
MGKIIRQINGSDVQDPSIIHVLEYNNSAGSKKVSEVGRKLIPLKYINSGTFFYTTDASSLMQLDKPGMCLAVFNPSANEVLSITVGESLSLTSLNPGITDSTGHVGIPCLPLQWTYVACGISNFVITNSSELMVFIIEDNTGLKQEVK